MSLAFMILYGLDCSADQAIRDIQRLFAHRTPRPLACIGHHQLITTKLPTLFGSTIHVSARHRAEHKKILVSTVDLCTTCGEALFDLVSFFHDVS